MMENIFSCSEPINQDQSFFISGCKENFPFSELRCIFVYAHQLLYICFSSYYQPFRCSQSARESRWIMQMNYFKRQRSVFLAEFWRRDDKVERNEIWLWKSELILVPTSALPQTNLSKKSGESIPKGTDGIVGTERVCKEISGSSITCLPAAYSAACQQLSND